jgi:hypothetical protein
MAQGVAIVFPQYTERLFLAQEAEEAQDRLHHPACASHACEVAAPDCRLELVGYPISAFNPVLDRVVYLWLSDHGVLQLQR